MPITDSMRLWAACVLVMVGLCAAAPSVEATTYLPVSFEGLVEQADVIFVGHVVDVHSYAMRVRNNTVIKTRVTFSVDDPVYGTRSLVEVLDFLGGEAGGLRMVVAGMPAFTVGDRRVVFARRRGSINPIVGFTQGLLQVRRDNGVERVLTWQGMPLARTESLGTAALQTSRAIDTAMPLSEFRTRVVRAVAAARKQ